MIAPEIMIVIAFTLMASAIYTMYRHFDEQICLAKEQMKFQLMDDILVVTSTDRRQVELLEQKLKDGLQSNSICCRSAIDRMNSRISIIEKNQTGSIKVIKKDTPKKEKSDRS